MFDAPVDAWYVWVGLSLVSLAALGTVSELPATPPPDATAAANTVDRVAAADHDATGRHPIDADAVWLSPDAIALRDDGRVMRARLRFGPVVPVGTDGPLAALLRGAPADHQFNSSGDLAAAVDSARNRKASGGSGGARNRTANDGDDGARWRRTDRLLVRTVTWGEFRVTLVGT